MPEWKMNKDILIKELHLEPHVEWGFFIRTYTSPMTITIPAEQPNKSDGASVIKERAVMSSIFYLLTTDSPVNYFNRNSSDIIHYFHLGLPIKYHTISPEGECSAQVLGPNILAGQKLQVMVPAGYWKAAELLIDGDSASDLDFGLLSEAVAPEFNYADWKLGTEEDIQAVLPHDWERYKHFIKPSVADP